MHIELTNHCLYIEPITHPEFISKAVFTDKIEFSTKQPDKWVDDTLQRYYSTSLKAKKYHAKIHFNIHRLTPILLTTKFGFLLFPLPKSTSKDTYWINLSKCYAFKSVEEGVSLEFTCGKEKTFSVPISVFEKQYTRALFLYDQYSKFIVARENRNHVNNGTTIMYNMSNIN